MNEKNYGIIELVTNMNEYVSQMNNMVDNISMSMVKSIKKMNEDGRSIEASEFENMLKQFPYEIQIKILSRVLSTLTKTKMTNKASSSSSSTKTVKGIFGEKW